MNKLVISRLKQLIVVFIGLVLVSCTSEPEGLDLSSYIDDSDFPSTAPLSFQLALTYQGATDPNYMSFNETGNTLCEATAGSPNVTCTADVPESQLYLSSTTFAVTFSSACSVMSFRPYRYQASAAASYLPPSATTGNTVDCDGTTTPLPTECFGGPAKIIVPSFPTYNSVFASPTGTYTTQEYSVDSANQLLQGSNRFIASDLAVANQGNTYNSAALGGIGDGYEPGSFRDYYISCEDAFGTPLYDITLIITETDGAVNDHLSFKEL